LSTQNTLKKRYYLEATATVFNLIIAGVDYSSRTFSSGIIPPHSRTKIQLKLKSVYSLKNMSNQTYSSNMDNQTEKKFDSFDYEKLFESYESGKITENSRLLTCLIETLGVKHDKNPFGEIEETVNSRPSN